MAGITRTITIKVNDIQPGKSVKNLKDDFKQLRKEVEGATERNDEYYKKVAQLQTLDRQIKSHNKNIRSTSQSWQKAQAANQEYDKGIRSTLKNFLSFKNLTAIGLATTLVQSAAAFSREIIQVSEEINQLRGDIQNLTGLADEELEQATAKARTLGTVFNEDAQEIALAANTLQNEFGGTFQENLELIEQGFLAGANANGEFLSQLREYPAQFAAAGSSAENMIEILTRSTKEGVFSDKGADVVKEFGLRIREQTTATKAAMENAFGSDFTNELFDNINSGAITTENALQQVASRMDETKIPANQLQTVIADVFGGPGEDAGLKFIKSLESVGEGMEAQIDTSNDLTQQRIKQLEAEQELAEVQVQLSAEIQGLTTGTGVLVTKLKTGLLQITIAVIRGFQNWIKWGKSLYENSTLIRKGVDFVSGTFKGLFTLITQWPQVSNGVAEAMKALVARVSNGFKNLYSEAVIAINRVKALVDKDALKVIDAEREKINARKAGQSIAEAYKKGFEAVQTPKIETTTTGSGNSDNQPPSGGSSNTPNASSSSTEISAAEQLYEKLRQLREESRLAQLSEDEQELERIRAKYQEQIDLAIAANEQGAVKELEALRDEEILRAIDNRNEQQIQKHQETLDQLLEQELEADIKEIEQLEASELEKQEKLEELEQQRIQKKREIEEQIAELNRSELENALLETQTFYDELIFQAEQYGIDVTDLVARRNEELARIEKEFADKSTEETKKATEEKMKAYSSLFSSVGSLFGTLAEQLKTAEGEATAASRAATLAQIAFDTASAISSVIAAAASTSITPIDMAAKIAAGVGIVITNIAKAKEVFASAPQRFTGGPFVIGEQDGKVYHPKYLSPQASGWLPSIGPVMMPSGVLANERGTEFYFSAQDMMRPAVASMVYDAYNLARGKVVPQFKDGGPNPVNGRSGASSAGMSEQTAMLLIGSLNRFNENVENGTFVKMGFPEAERINELIQEGQSIRNG